MSNKKCFIIPVTITREYEVVATSKKKALQIIDTIHDGSDSYVESYQIKNKEISSFNIRDK